MILKSSGKIIDLNCAALTQLKFEKEDLVGKSIKTIIPSITQMKAIPEGHLQFTLKLSDGVLVNDCRAKLASFNVVLQADKPPLKRLLITFNSF